MTTSTTAAGATAGSQTHIFQLAMAALLGLFVVGFSGFSHIEALHNAGHDYRHSMAFPCH